LSHSITRRSASNLALAFVMLPRDRREAMASLYAFCREVDDVADEDSRPIEDRQRRLEEWRSDVKSACSGGAAGIPVIRELAPAIARYRLPFELFDDLIRGVEMDLTVRRYSTYEEVERYCYRVASVVGLLSIEVFGYRQPGCRDYAVTLGKAFQWTNILRDVGNDAQRGRIYLPQEALAQHGVREEEILQGLESERFGKLAREISDRARRYYLEAREVLPEEDRHNMVAAELMGSVYWRLLLQLERSGFRVLGTHAIRLGKATKLFLVLRAWCRFWLGAHRSDYGGDRTVHEGR
jgi:phytoene synthase